MTELPSQRHLQREGLIEFLSAGNPARLPLEGNPLAFLVIEPTDERVAVRVPWPADALPDLSGYKHLSGSEVVSAGVRWFEFAVIGSEFLVDAYPILCAAVDRIQLDGMSVADAINAVLDNYQELLGSIGRLSDDQEVGLYGELLVLEQLCRVLGSEAAVASWRGAAAEEHDFGISDVDCEVKTTVAERRRHWIASVTQLQQSPGRDLWLLSIQVTAAGMGGRALPQLIDDLRNIVVDPALRTIFEGLLTSMRYDDTHAKLYTRTFRLRSAPALFRIDAGFPAITRSVLDRTGLDAGRIMQLAYQLDLDGWPVDEGPDVFRKCDWGAES